MLATRTGSVLGPSTILKADNYPSLYSNRMRQTIPGAPNFRRVPGYAVYGVGISTISGIKAVLESMDAGPSSSDLRPCDASNNLQSSVADAVESTTHAAGAPQNAEAATTSPSGTALWHNLREEPVLYINGTPYVLREAAGPYKNMKEYSGIRAESLEEMEARLKADVLAEGRRLGGKVLVLNEYEACPWFMFYLFIVGSLS